MAVAQFDKETKIQGIITQKILIDQRAVTEKKAKIGGNVDGAINIYVGK